MKTLKQHFEDLLENTKKWNYYDLDVDEKLEDILNNPKDFITSYLKAGDKLPPEVTNIIDNLSIERLQHTVSIFFLGLIFYSENENVKTEIDNYLKTTIEKIQSREFNLNHNFTYWWFLICFIHDIGYAYKNNTELELFETKDNCKIEKKIKEELNKITKFAENIIPEQIVNNWKKYLKFRKKEENNKIDHGILGGAYYIYTLNKITIKKLGDKKEIEKNGLFWSKKMLNRVHKPIAWIIVAHNIWYKNRNYEDTKEYEDEKNCLSDLIISKPILNLNKYPLYFLLSLVDTIDPIKFVTKKKDNMKISDILKNTNFHIEKDKFNIG